MFGSGGWQCFRNCLVEQGAAALHRTDGKPLIESCHRRRSLQSARWFGLPQVISSRSHVSAEISNAIFIPFLEFNHFGHLLTETAGWLSSLLADSLNNRLPRTILLGRFACTYRDELARVIDWPLSSIFATNQLSGLTRLKRAWIPVPSMINRDRIYLCHFKAVERILDKVYGISVQDLLATPKSALVDYGKMIYLSRSRLAPDLRLLEGEGQLEKELSNLGWTIIHPQELSISDQLLHLHAAGVIAGPIGSAFHLLMALGRRRVKYKRVITIGLANELTQPGPGQNCGMHLKLQGFDCCHLSIIRHKRSGNSSLVNSRNSLLSLTIEAAIAAQMIDELGRDFLTTYAFLEG